MIIANGMYKYWDNKVPCASSWLTLIGSIDSSVSFHQSRHRSSANFSDIYEAMEASNHPSNPGHPVSGCKTCHPFPVDIRIKSQPYNAAPGKSDGGLEGEKEAQTAKFARNKFRCFTFRPSRSSPLARTVPGPRSPASACRSFFLGVSLVKMRPLFISSAVA